MDLGRDLSGATALVTGASSGIGAATARALAAEGATVVLAARREDRLRALADDLTESHGVEAIAVPTDVTDEDAVDALVEATVERTGGLDLVVSNAGVASGGDRGLPADDRGQLRRDVLSHPGGAPVPPRERRRPPRLRRELRRAVPPAVRPRLRRLEVVDTGVREVGRRAGRRRRRRHRRQPRRRPHGVQRRRRVVRRAVRPRRGRRTRGGGRRHRLRRDARPLGGERTRPLRPGQALAVLSAAVSWRGVNPLAPETRALVLVHGRGASAETIAALAWTAAGLDALG